MPIPLLRISNVRSVYNFRPTLKLLYICPAGFLLTDITTLLALLGFQVLSIIIGSFLVGFAFLE